MALCLSYWAASSGCLAACETRLTFVLRSRLPYILVIIKGGNMETGLIHSTLGRQAVYYKLRRQVVCEFQSEIGRAIGWRKDWLRWKRGITLEIRYNELLFSRQTRRRTSLT